MKRFLKSTTALIMTASLAVPASVLSQEIDFDISGMTQDQIAAELVERGIVTGDDAEAQARMLAEQALAGAGDAVEAGEDSADPEVAAENAPSEDAPQEGEPVSEASETAESESEQAPEPEAEVSEETPVPTEIGEELPETQQDGDGGDVETVAEEGDNAAVAKEDREAPTDVGEELPETEVDDAPATEEADDAEAAETEPEAPAGAPGAADETNDDMQNDDETSQQETGDAEEPAETSEDAAEVDPEPMDSEAQAEAEARAATEGEASLAASAEGGAEAQVVEETVTEETARSSSEEFETDLDGETRREDEDDDDDDDDGLSNFEKFAILGLGTVALSQILAPDEEVVTNTGDRVVVERDGQYRLLKDDDALLRRPGSDVTTYQFEDGSTRTVVIREDGTQVETIRARDGRVLRRTRILGDGREVVLFDDTREVARVDVNQLPQVTDRRQVDIRQIDTNDLAAALSAQQGQDLNRRFSLSQVRNIDAVRELVPEINVDTINFETNSAVIRPEEAQELEALGRAISRMIEDNPGEVFLIEGHTDAVGGANYNLALSDRRAESVALALTEYFDVPPENLVVQGYGESDLLIRTPDAERANRRAAVRRITPLLTEG